MSDGMGNFRGGGSGATPYRLLRQQKKALKQAGKKLQEIDKIYSTKLLKDDIQAESLLADIHDSQITIAGTTIGAIITTTDNKIILIKHKSSGRGFPKGGIDPGETQLQCLYREIEEETGIVQSSLQLIKELGSYDSYSSNHQVHKTYKRYQLQLINEPDVLRPQDKSIIQVEKFDTEFVLDILDSEHQKNFWKSLHL